jgi:hypothetical protein
LIQVGQIVEELLSGTHVRESGRPLFFKVELHGGIAIFYNELSNGDPEALYTFNGTETAIERRFNFEIVEGEKFWFDLSGGARAFVR